MALQRTTPGGPSQTDDNCTGDYDCPASAHIDGCFVFDKRQADDDRDPYDAAVVDVIKRLDPSFFECSTDAGFYRYYGGDREVWLHQYGGRSRRIPFDR